MRGTDDLCGAKAPQPFRDHGSRWRDVLGGEQGLLLGGARLLAQTDQLAMARGCGLPGRDKGQLVLRAPGGSATGQHADPIRVI